MRKETMAALYGQLTEFDPGIEGWVTHAERLEQYFTANDITTNEKKRAILLRACGTV